MDIFSFQLLMEEGLLKTFTFDFFSDKSRIIYSNLNLKKTFDILLRLSSEKIKSNNMEKRLGKIKNVRFGIGGYQDCQLGAHFELGGDSWGVTDSRSVWDPTRVKCEEYTQWTEEDRNKQMNDIMRYVSSLLKDAKVDIVEELAGKPIECSFDGNILKEWRILTEVL